MTAEEEGIKNNHRERKNCRAVVCRCAVHESFVCTVYGRMGDGVPMLDGLIDELEETVPRKMTPSE